MRGLGYATFAFALLFAGAAGAAGETGAAERAQLRIGEHPGFSRLVFDWEKPVKARLERSPGRAILHFARPGELNLKRFRADPPPEVKGISVASGAGGLTVTLTIIPGAELRLFEDEGNVVLDVLRPETPKNAKAATPQDWRERQAAKRKTKSRPEEASDESNAQIARKAAPPAPVSGRAAAAPPLSLLPTDLTPKKQTKPEASNKATAKASKLATAPIPKAKPAAPKTVAPKIAAAAPVETAQAEAPAAKPAAPKPAAPKTASPKTAAAAPVETAKTEAPGIKTEAPAVEAAVAGLPATHAPLELRPEAGKSAESEAKSASADPALKGPKRAIVSAEPAPILINTAPAAGRSVNRVTPGSLRFDWDTVVAAAAYRQGPHVWLIFDRSPPAGLADLVEKSVPELAPIELVESPDATVLRLTVPVTHSPQLIAQGSTWIVDFRPELPVIDQGIEVELDNNGRTTEILFQAAGSGRKISFTDPESGIIIHVVPLTTAGQGLAAGREYPQFRALASSQGLVIEPFSEDIKIEVEDGTVRVSASEGLFVSYGSTLARLRSNVPTPARGLRLFDLQAWRRGEVAEFRINKHRLMRALSEAKPEEAAVARMDLARFYFAHSLASEAMGMLRLREIEAPRLEADPEARLIRGAIMFLNGDFESAAKDIYHPALDGEWEAGLWQAAMAAVSLDWPQAAERFEASRPLIADYPHSVRMRLRLLAAEARLGIGDTKGASEYLETARQDRPTLGEEARIAYLVARRLQMEGELETAIELWQRVAESTHPPSRARARLKLLDVALEDGSLDQDQAIKELERLRFEWRGDQFEFALLQRLGDLYMARQDYRKGLHALRQAASQFPNSERAKTVAQRMSDVFTGLYLGSAGEKMPTLSALALYQEFKELTPAGARGDKLITHLADRLVDVDLLDRAAEILESQIEFRLQGLEKALTGVRLAVIRLLDDEPAKAVEALASSEIPNLPEPLVRERRYLKAQALAEMDRQDEALVQLGTDDSLEALRLRSEILWSQQNWSAAAILLARLVPEKPPADRALTGVEVESLINLAVALTLAGDGERLRELGKTYVKAMADSPYSATFVLLVGDLEPGRTKSIAEELAQAQQAESFLAGYRKRLQHANLSELN